ncbi:MAG: diphthamide synthesis protein [Candidatus Nanoarchaeia archaeon]|nr:diphthamide synthesis protein [Candidatus Nanoarchaeia archaeon]MDD5740779.1 diphthamide synthesis protein [Candidatus Nanoarchaeia archaeon]
MERKTIQEINEIYDLELDKIVKAIKQKKAKKVLLQFPDGMKPYSMVIADEIKNKTGCECMIWSGDCFGACDIPNVDNLKPKIDLIIQFGHTEWKFN